MEQRRFYVYEWFIVDTLEVFYVGKGTGMRRFETHNRNKYFNNILKKYKCAVRIVYSYLTNEEACELEKERIAYMWTIGWAKCNFTNGGTGFSEGYLNPVHKRVHSEDYVNPFTKLDVKGEHNPFFGKQHTEETKRKISLSRKGKGGRFGKDNPMYGKGFKGEDNPMYGKTGFSHPNSKMYKIEYTDGITEILKYKDCEKKFGIAFIRIYENGGLLHYKKKTPKDMYEGTKITRVK